MINYFSERKHITMFGGGKSTELSISASVVQGSALGPAAFIITASDLHPVHSDNKQAKYADDMYLIVGSAKYHTIPEELYMSLRGRQKTICASTQTKQRK